MSEPSGASSPQEPPPLGASEVSHVRGTTSRIWHVILIAFIAIMFTAVFITGYEWLNEMIWFSNGYAVAHRWIIPVGVLGFSLLVGLSQKYLNAPTVIHGGFVESIKGGGEKANYRTFPGALLSSLFSLLSGASVGPEGTIAILVSDIAVFTREKLRIAVNSASDAFGFDVAALASAFNGNVWQRSVYRDICHRVSGGGKERCLQVHHMEPSGGIYRVPFLRGLGHTMIRPVNPLHTHCRTIIDNPAEVGIAMLLLLAVLKVLLLALSFKSGYIGGPIFPILFSSTMIALALSLAFPGIPVSIFVLCIETASITLALVLP
jgi:H+/Cl- antiporter ClcA